MTPGAKQPRATVLVAHFKPPSPCSTQHPAHSARATLSCPLARLIVCRDVSLSITTFIPPRPGTLSAVVLRFTSSWTLGITCSLAALRTPNNTMNLAGCVTTGAQHAAAAITTRAHRTASQAPWRRPKANTCRISAAITDTCTATTAGSVPTATVRYQDKPPHTHRHGEGSAQHRAREHGALSHLDDRRAGGLGIDCYSGSTRRAARWRHATERSGGGRGSQRGPRSICFATPSPLAPAATGRPARGGHGGAE